jgi:hypothetical protein
MGVRKNYRNLTTVERARFVQALFQVKSTGGVDQFADMHATHFFHGIHRSSHFLPWHREMLLRFERELQKIRPDITLPYWDSTVDRSPSDPLWNNNFLGQFDSAWNLGRALGSGPLSTLQEVEANQGRDNYDSFWRQLENPIHNRPHVWVGGVMSGLASPGDPVFYLHHCWIDLLWARWQLSHPGAPFISSGTGAGLKDPLMEWPDRTPADVLDHHALGYKYDIEVPRDGPWAKRGDNVPEWSDASGWADPSNYSTMRLAVANNDLYLLARGDDGVDTWRFDTATSTWSKRSDNTPQWSDASGWNDVTNYSTMHLAVANNNLYLLARTDAGIDTWRFDTATSEWTKRGDNVPEWSDASGWADPSNYSTMRLAVANNDLYLLARGDDGVDTWRFRT